MLPPRPSPLQLDMRWDIKPFSNKCFSDMCTRSEKTVLLIVWSYQKMLSENVISEKAFFDHIRSGFLVPYQKSRFPI